MTLYTDADMGDYAEKVLACLAAQKRYFGCQSRDNLIAAKTAEMELAKLSRAILEQLGRTPTTAKPTSYQPSLFDNSAPALPPD